MYVACRKLKISVPGEDGKTKVVTVLPGETIPGAEAWTYPNLIAHLNVEAIKWAGSAEKNAPHNSHRNQAVVIPLIFRQMAPKTSPSTPPRPEQSSNSVPVLSCEACKGKTFKSKAGLSSHQKIKHPEISQTKAG